MLYAATGTTKSQILEYYTAVAPLLLTYAGERPVTRERWPDGTESKSFFEKNLPAHTPDWVTGVEIEHSSRTDRYPVLDPPPRAQIRKFPYGFRLTFNEVKMSITVLNSLVDTLIEMLPEPQWWTTDRVVAATNMGVVLIATITAAIGLRAIFQTREMIKQNEVLRAENAAASLNSQRQQEEYNRLASISAESQAESMKLQRQAIERGNRPILTARYPPPDKTISDLYLEISNVGNSVAYNVEVQFDPPLPEPNLDALNANSRTTTTYRRPNIEFAAAVFVDRTFRTWVPGQTVTVPFWVPNKDYKADDRTAPSAEGVPPDQRVHLTYRNEAFNIYEESFDLDPGIWAGVLFSESDASRQRKAIEKLANTAERQGRTITGQLSSIVTRFADPEAKSG